MVSYSFLTLFLFTDPQKICIWSKTSNSDGSPISPPVLSYSFLIEYLTQCPLSLWLLKSHVLQENALMKVLSPQRFIGSVQSTDHQGAKRNTPFFGLQGFSKEHSSILSTKICTRNSPVMAMGFLNHSFPPQQRTNLYISFSLHNFSIVAKHFFIKQ